MNAHDIKVIYEDEGLKIWTDGFSPIVFIRIQRFPKGRNAQDDYSRSMQVCIKGIHAIYKKVYCLIDLTGVKEPSEEDLLLLHKLEKIAVLPPSNIFVVGTFDQLYENLYASFFEALNEINGRMNAKNTLRNV